MDRDEDHLEFVLPPGLKDLYDGNLPIHESLAERPYVISNFVSTLDGVVSYGMKGHAEGSTISGSDPADRFIMGLLRASADAIMVGARTVQDSSPQSLWIPEFTYREAKGLYTDYRLESLRKPVYPLLVVVSGSGNLELNRAIFQTPGVSTIVMTTSEGRDTLLKAGAAKLSTVQIHALDATDGVLAPQAMLRILFAEHGIRRLLHEGGPSLFGQFMAAEEVDELFLTLSPQIAGRTAGALRPALVEGTEFTPDSAPWFQLLTVKQSTDHLYLRYSRTSLQLGGRI
jgi:riboflavin biosynthesis pyrimidine reductase